jgi:hypothetical protein
MYIFNDDSGFIHFQSSLADCKTFKSLNEFVKNSNSLIEQNLKNEK